MKFGPILDRRRRTSAKSSSSKEQHNINESSGQDDDCSTPTSSGERSKSNTTVPSIRNSASPSESRRPKEPDTQVVRTTSSASNQADSGEAQVAPTTHPIPNKDEIVDLFGIQLYLCGNIGCEVRTETPLELEV